MFDIEKIEKVVSEKIEVSYAEICEIFDISKEKSNTKRKMQLRTIGQYYSISLALDNSKKRYCRNKFILKHKLKDLDKAFQDEIKRIQELDLQKDNDLFNTICDYFKTELLGYTTDQKLDKNTILKLRGLKTGTYMGNTSQKSKSNYDYEIILNTLKLSKIIVQKAIETKSFKNEEHKINYILKIIDSKINDVYMLKEEKKQEEQSINNLDINSIIGYNNQQYVRKTKDNKTSNLLKGLW